MGFALVLPACPARKHYPRSLRQLDSSATHDRLAMKTRRSHNPPVQGTGFAVAIVCNPITAVWQLVLVMVALSSTALAPLALADTRLEEKPAEVIERPWTTSLYLENDMFGNTDQDYTSGIRLSWISPNLASYRGDPAVPPIVNRVNERLDKMFDFRTGLSRNVVISLGQLIYTPSDREARELLEDERPYAGYLYLSFGFHARTAQRLDSVEVNIGVVGPASLAQQSQNAIHDLRGIDRFQGWRNQLRNEPALRLVYENKLRLFKHDLFANIQHDFISHAGLALGNVGSYVNVGGEYRFGWDLPEDFGTSAVRPAGDNSAPGAGDNRLIISDRWLHGLHGFISVDGRAVANDIFLDGNTWRDSHSVDKRHFVADVSIGVSFLVRQWKISYAQVFRTREFKGQDKHHEYGSLGISYTW